MDMLARLLPSNVHRQLHASLGAIALLILSLPLSAAEKVRVTDPVAAKRLTRDGAQLLADYGSYQVFAVDNARVVSALPGAEVRPDYDQILLNAQKISTNTAEARAQRKAVANFDGKRLHLVQFVGPTKPEWIKALTDTGVTVVTYIPNNAYLVYGTAGSLQAMQASPKLAGSLQWDTAYVEDHKIDAKVRNAANKNAALGAGPDLFAVQMVEDPAVNRTTLAAIDGLKLEPALRQDTALGYVNVIVRIAPARIKEVAALPDVVSIQPYVVPKKRDERQGQIVAGNLNAGVPTGPGYMNFLATKGFTQAQFTTSGFAVDVTDSGVDNGTPTVNHFGLRLGGNIAAASRVVYNRLIGTPNAGSTNQGCDGHGNINAHIIGGFNDLPTGFPHTDAAGYHFGLGIAPFVKVGSSVIFDPNNFTSPDYEDLLASAYNDGARVSSNSWGADTAGAYNSDSQRYDALVRDSQPTGSAFPVAGNQQMVVVFAAGNAGGTSQTVGSPGTGKNVITVGAAENVHSHATGSGGNSAVGNDGCNTPDAGANSADDIIGFSSRGPCADGRYKPDLVAPGTHITGGVGQASAIATGNGAALACFAATGVCALPGGGTVGDVDNFFPLGQQFYTTSSGTSHSTPAVAGGAALVRQFFINQSLPPPTPSMTKAVLVNSARYMTGTDANDTLPSKTQGLGGMNLGFAFDGVPRVMRDEVPADKFTASGQVRAITGTITDNTKPFRVTLAWTDAPGSTAGSAFKNDLDLVVSVGGQTYKGNVFSGGNSVTGGTADTRNNVESVFIPAGVTGNFSVTVTAANINSDGVPNDADVLDQDFSIVVYNATAVALPVIVSNSTISAESCVNGFMDPSESITIDVALQNIGQANSSNLVATLLATGGVTSPTGPQTYGAMTVGGAAVTKAFSFVANGACGGTVTLSVQLQDGALDLGVVTQTFQLGELVQNTLFTEKFDTVTAPALPAAWTTAITGGGLAWATVTTGVDTAPNAAFSSNRTTTSTSELVSPVITLAPGVSNLSFRNNYDTEQGFDGGVLEIKVGAGAFTDIITAGGSFQSGAYNTNLDSTNPFGVRAGWSGNSGGYINTVITLPASAAGQNVQFRWRLGCDSSVAAVGWSIDGISVFQTLPMCCDAGGSNVAPTLNTIANPPAIPEDTAVQVVVLTGITAGAAETQPLTVTAVSSDTTLIPHPTVFYTSPDNAGALAYTPVANKSGTATVTVMVNDGQPLNNTAIRTFTVSVTPVNDAPIILGQNPVSVLEETARTISFSDLVVIDPDNTYPSGFSLTVQNGTNYARVGNTITPAANFNGTLTVPVLVNDGTAPSAPFSLSVSVTSVNDVPVITGQQTLTVAEDAQLTVTLADVSVTDSDNTFPIGFTISVQNGANYTHVGNTITPALNFNGALNVPVIVNDGTDDSAPVNLTVSVTAVNDPPSFDLGGDQSVEQGDGPQVVEDFASGILPGPVDEAGQTLEFLVTPSNPGLFTTPPAISPAGELTYTPADGASGSATVTVQLRDNGAGTNTSAPKTFQIAVTTFGEEVGTYNGLALPSPGATPGADKTGVIKFTLGAKGKFTGSLKLGRFTHKFRGTIDNAGDVKFGKDGTATATLTRKNLPSLVLDLDLDVSGGSDKLTGTITENAAPFAIIEADRAVYSAKVNPMALPGTLIGKYTVIFDEPVAPGLAANEFPHGDGYATLKVDKKGVAKIIGRLADGSKFSSANSISKLNTWPLWASILKGAGALAGAVQFQALAGPPASDLAGPDLLWFKPAGEELYPSGWPTGITTDLFGSSYKVPPKTAPASVLGGLTAEDGDGNANITLTLGGLPGVGLSKALNISLKNKVSIIDEAADELKLSITTGTGFVKGSFVDPGTGESTEFRGVIYQKAQFGSGYFLGPVEGGAFSIVPVP